MRKLAQGANEKLIELVGGELASLEILEIPTFEELYHYGIGGTTFQRFSPLAKSDVDSAVMILHSSGKLYPLELYYLKCWTGSTSFPKPILLTHRNLLQWGSQPCMPPNFIP